MPSVMWFRRDLRLGDNPALLDACAADDVLPLFVIDPALWGPSGPVRRSYLGASLRALDASLRPLGGDLSVVHGDPVQRVLLAASEVGATRVHIAADHGPYGHRRDAAVEESLAARGIELVRTGSPYAVPPGRITSGSGAPYKIYTPFSRAWADHGWRAPVEAPTGGSWLSLGERSAIPEPALPDAIELPEAGEAAALRGWRGFVEDRVDDYAEARDKPGVNGTSHLSAHLKYGEIHPRTILADLSRHDSTGAATYRKEIAWRDFNPTSQGRKFDPKADYVRRWLPELSLARDPHDPDSEDRAAAGYPEPIVDHKAERREALNRWEKIRQ